MYCHTRLVSTLSLATVFAVSAFHVAESQETDHRSILVRVIDEDERPVSDASVRLYYRDLFVREEKEFETDASGVAIVELPTIAQFVAINVTKSGYVPKANRWNILSQEVPDALEIQLQKGARIGGEVHNSRGDPIAGAHVALSLNAAITRFSGVDESSNLFIVEEPHAPVTDNDGRWSYSGVPADATVGLSITHPDYVGDQNFSTKYERVSQSELREQTSLAILVDGIRIHGQVLSPEGRPVSVADVCMRSTPPGYSPTSRAKCDSSGKFQMPAASSGKYEIAVVAKDYSPVFVTYETSSQRLPLRIELKAGRTIRMRVVDSEDRPIRAFVSLKKCSGKDGDHLYYPTPLVPARTDSQGRFEWNHAPNGELVFGIGSPGFESSESTFAANESPTETVVKLQREAILSGRVIDRKTKKPIDRFMVFPFIANQSIFRSMGVVGREGQFELPLSRVESHGSNFHLMIEHAGHKTVLTDESFGKSKLAKDLEIEMESTDPISGVVVDADKKPIRDAVVTLSERSTGFFATRSMELGRVLTDADGKFSFPAPPGDFFIAAASSEGFLKENFDEQQNDLGELKLNKWSSVNGRVLDRDGKPCENYIVIIRPSKNSSRGLPHSQTVTDRDGRFTLDRVPGVPCELWTYSPRNAQGVASNGVSKKIDVRAGEQTTVDIKLD